MVFTLTLPSNGSPTQYPNNTVTTFKNKLSETIDLRGPGKYEVGLSEIQFPTFVANVNNCWVYVEKERAECDKVHFANGFYKDSDEFFEILARNLSIAGCDCTVDRNKFSGLVSITILNRVTLHMSINLTRLLGFDITSLNNDSDAAKTFTSGQASDLFRGLSHFYVYSNLGTDVALGHVQAPLLRVVNSNIHNAPTAQCLSFTKINYVPLSLRNIDSVLVYLRLQDGSPVPFMSGTCIVTLLIRRVLTL